MSVMDSSRVGKDPLDRSLPAVPGILTQPNLGPGAAHAPQPYGDVAGVNSGVLCSCGEDFKINRRLADTSKGKPSKRRLRTMTQCWDAYRQHWAAR
jgi:hypothetical protein